MNILLIEDEVNVSSFIKKGLEEESFNVSTAFDGYTGKDLAIRESYDLIILDLVLPQLNGIEVCRILREAKIDTPILMLTALLRRTQFRTASTVLEIGGLELNDDTKEVRRYGRKIKLTAMEYSLLHYLMSNAGVVKSRIQIIETVWGNSYDTGSNVVDVYINYLRNKIDKDFSPKLIHTVTGMGYMLKESQE